MALFPVPGAHMTFQDLQITNCLFSILPHLMVLFDGLMSQISSGNITVEDGRVSIYLKQNLYLYYYPFLRNTNYLDLVFSLQQKLTYISLPTSCHTIKTLLICFSKDTTSNWIQHTIGAITWLHSS